MPVWQNNQTQSIVVPRTGYVDRNYAPDMIDGALKVVPRTGYVDRNKSAWGYIKRRQTSYPARGTWIEMILWPVPRPR